ncbi:hypothetical protein, partial [Puia sp.]|uniref:hypothetical protein n=1 Tax=Puia sp. TaxID=2045100 RepID=UPI002F3E7EA2
RMSNAMYFHNYYKVWAVGAISSVFIFAIIFNGVTISAMRQKLAPAQFVQVFPAVNRVQLFFWIASIPILVFIVLRFVDLPFKEGDPTGPIHHMNEYCDRNFIQQLVQLYLVTLFSIFDLTLHRAYKKALALETDKEKKEDLEHELDIVKKTIWFVDVPSFLAFSFMFLYYYLLTGTEQNKIEYVDHFIGGAEAFALISFNIIYILIIFQHSLITVFSKINFKKWRLLN